MASFPPYVHPAPSWHTQTLDVCPVDNQMNIIKCLLVSSIVTNTPQRRRLFENTSQALFFYPPPHASLEGCERVGCFCKPVSMRSHLALLWLSPGMDSPIRVSFAPGAPASPTFLPMSHELSQPWECLLEEQRVAPALCSVTSPGHADQNI